MLTISCTSSSIVILHYSHAGTYTQIHHPRQPHTCSVCCSQLVVYIASLDINASLVVGVAHILF